MPALDFTEIAPAHQGPARDQFELFGRDVLEALGFQIVRGPDRGPDIGRDLIVRDARAGAGGSTTVDFLVSCKHKAHSGTAVGEADDRNLRDRIDTHGCDGLIAFYSTVPSSTLSAHLDGLRKHHDVLIFDAEQIEARLLAFPAGRTIAARYFPKSFSKWIISSQYAEAPTLPRPLPITDRYFLRQPHTNLTDAKAEAQARNLPVFAVTYDAAHSSRSELEYCLSCFMRWETTKRLVDENFVPAVGPSDDPAFSALVPADDPLEECRLTIFVGDIILRSETVYANASEGRKRVLAAILADRVRRSAA